MDGGRCGPDAAARSTHARIVRLAWTSGYPALRTDMSSAPARAVITAADKAAGGRVALLR